MRRISLVHPSRSRPQMALSVARLARQKADQPFEYILAIDDDDPEAGAYRDAFEAFQQEGDRLLVSPSRNCVQAINHAASKAQGEVIMVVSDDFELPDHWDKLILEATAGRECWLLKTWDGQQPWIATLPIMDRALYQQLGYVYHPAYKHMFADTHLSSICDYLGVTLYRLDIHIPHWHYTTSKNQKDGVNERADATFRAGMELYLGHHRQQYGLAPGQIKGRITHGPHLAWIAQRLGR